MKLYSNNETLNLEGWRILIHNGQQYINKGSKRIPLPFDIMAKKLQVTSADLEYIRGKIAEIEG